MESPHDERRGRLKVYLGVAPGVGKTFAMLREGQWLRAQGRDVVVGFVETYRRPRTDEAVGDLEVVPRLQVPYRGALLQDMDLDAVLARRPQVALVDELAHTNVPGMRNHKRWQDVEALRQAGIDVITTVNVQHVESVKDLVERITGIPVRETVPDHALDGADDIQYIDTTPEALRKRMRHGNIYGQEQVEAALANFFRPGNLAALREIGLRMVADSLAARRGVHPPGEDVLIAVGANTPPAVIRRGARMARRLNGLAMVVAVLANDGDPAAIDERAELARQLGCSFSVLGGGDAAAAIEQAARDSGARHVVLAAPPPGLPWERTLHDRVIDRLPEVDVHIIARPAAQGRDRDGRPDPNQVVGLLEHRRAAVRVYLGYARGCGATTRMLEEAQRRRSRGTDVVVAAVKPPGRGPEALQGLELLGEAAMRDQLDVDALLARNCEVACIDDLTAPDTEGRPRFKAVGRLVGAGMIVLATVHLLDLHDVRATYADLVGQAGRPLLDDQRLLAADEIELVDVPPEELLGRLRRGEAVPPWDAARAMRGEFRPDVLASLRESALRILADHTDRRVVSYMREGGVTSPWETRVRMVMCVQPVLGLEGRIEAVARRAAARDAHLTVLSVRTGRLSPAQQQLLGDYARLVHGLGGEFVTRYSRDVASAIVEYVRSTPTTELIMGRRDHSRRFGRDVTKEVLARVRDLDVHVVGRKAPGRDTSLTSLAPSGESR